MEFVVAVTDIPAFEIFPSYIVIRIVALKVMFHYISVCSSILNGRISEGCNQDRSRLVRN